MRYVDQQYVETKLLAWDEWPAWEQKTHAALAELEGAPPQRRKVLLREDRMRLWTKVKAVLKKVSYGKCWYCDASLEGKSGDVDHFRPKARVVEDPYHGGYWWRALDWRNFRLACEKCNRLETNPGDSWASGKGDHFPLLNPEERATCERRDCSCEKPGLLDPFEREDSELVEFSSGRRICGTPKRDDTKRFDWSSRYYNWRRPELRENLADLYVDLRECLNSLSSIGEPSQRNRLKDRVGKYLRPEAPFSHPARKFLVSLETEDNRDLIREMLAA